ncbi:hypothetical protein [Nocardia xishanensis]
MRAPTRAQVKVLKALQNQSVLVGAMLATATEHQQQTGQRPPRSWYAEFHDRAVARDALAEAAFAGGVPREWIDHVRERGGRGVGWRAELYLRTPEPVDWDRVLTHLNADVQRLREWTALHASGRPDGAGNPPGLATGMARNLHVLWARTTGVANLLGLTASHGRELWGSIEDWVAESAATLDGLPAEGVAQRWQQAARTDTTSYALQATALTEAGIATGTSPAMPSHADIAAPTRAVLTVAQPLFRAAPGADIEATIEAASLTYDSEPDTTSAVFSDPAATHAWSPELVEATEIVMAPQWQEPDP